MWSCSVLLEVQFVRVSFGSELWHYHVTKNIQIIVSINISIKEHGSYDTFAGQCTPRRNAWLMQLGVNEQIWIFTSSVHTAMPVHMSGQFETSLIISDHLILKIWLLIGYMGTNRFAELQPAILIVLLITMYQSWTVRLQIQLIHSASQ